ncbi:hypothetical protein ACFX13_023637 [Malus domestica]
MEKLCFPTPQSKANGGTCTDSQQASQQERQQPSHVPGRCVIGHKQQQRQPCHFLECRQQNEVPSTTSSPAKSINYPLFQTFKIVSLLIRGEN